MIFVTCAALYVVSTTLPVLFTVRIAQGLAWGWITTALGTIVADLAPADRRGEAVGFRGLAPPSPWRWARWREASCSPPAAPSWSSSRPAWIAHRVLRSEFCVRRYDLPALAL